MTQRIQIDEPIKKERAEHLKKTIEPLQGKSISNLSQKDLQILLEHICSLHRLCDSTGKIL